MKLSTAALLPAFSLATSITLPTAFTYDARLEPGQFGTLDPVAARVVLAQRLGVEDFHRADLESSGVIDAINHYGTRKLLLSGGEISKKTALLLLEDNTRPRGEWPVFKKQSGFEILPSPDALATRNLFVDLARQARPQVGVQLTDDELFAQLRNADTVSQDDNLIHVAESSDDLEAVFSRLVKEGGWSITAFIAPASDDSVSQEKVQWGTYEMPNSQSPLKKRQRKEEPLTETTGHKPVHSTSVPYTPLANSEPLRGILPSCFASQSACMSATRNCTGHGKCSLKYRDEQSRGNKECYSCKCTPPTHGDGKLATRWAGPACQKKDVSVEFWLITLFTVGLIFLIGFAIGQIWEMGEQELPSVIGAGVSGPSARK